MQRLNSHRSGVGLESDEYEIQFLVPVGRNAGRHHSYGPEQRTSKLTPVA